MLAICLFKEITKMLSSTSPTSRISSPSKSSPKKRRLSATPLSENKMPFSLFDPTLLRNPITRAEHKREETWRTIDENEKPAKRPKTFEPSDPKFKAAQKATAKLLFELQIADH